MDCPEHTESERPADPRTVTFVVASLRCGGVERAVISLAVGLRARGHRVCLLSLAGAEDDFFAIPEGVERHALGITRHRPVRWWRLPATVWGRLRALRRAIDATRPDVVIAHAPQINVPTLLATRGARYPVIATEHGDVPVIWSWHRSWLWRKWTWYRLRRWCYRFAHQVVSVSAAVDRNVGWLRADRRRVIHNPLTPIRAPAVDVPNAAGRERPWIVSVGRLSHAKGHDILIEAFALLAARFRDWQLVIVGDGELRHTLMHQARGLGDQVVFAGATDPFPWLRRAQLFATASRYEGFPLAPAEALSCGVSVIATDCPSAADGRAAGGIRELIGKGGGLLVPANDPRALAEALSACMADPELRARLASEARGAVADLRLDRIVAQWESLFEHVSPRERRRGG